MKPDTPTGSWTPEDARDCYQVDAWGAPYFSVDARGQVVVAPRGDGQDVVGLHDLAVDLRRRGIELPVLVRFPEILEHRVRALTGAFEQAISEYGYAGGYRPVYPIKVNQQCDIIEDLLRGSADLGLGLEVGSKPELLVALAYMQDGGAIICNGYKDRVYIETALLAQQLGRQAILVVDRFEELEWILEIAADLGVEPSIGVRARLASRGAGRWTDSGGNKSKFGLSASEILQVLDRLAAVGRLDALQLLHFHLGSQITEIRAIKEALRESARLYVQLHRSGATPRFIDVGGGLGVDYDGSRTNSTSSVNYSLQEYANDIVDAIQQVCDETGTPHPDIFSESGRAISAYHSVLVFDVLGTNQVERPAPPAVEDLGETRTLLALRDAWRRADEANYLESYHDATQLRDEAMNLFNLGYLSLRERSMAEELFTAVCLRARQYARVADPVPEELEALEAVLSETYFCNFSLFQSVPDSWAIGQLFPVMPVHRLDERPTHLGTLADLTCDSDGKVARFIDGGEDKPALELHGLDGRPYLIGMFLIGAYQETLGDLHNLFGDTNAVHVHSDARHGYRIDRTIEGDKVHNVLEYVFFEKRDLTRRVRRATEEAVRKGTLTLEQSARLVRRYEEGLAGSTYLAVKDVAAPRADRPPREATMEQ